MQSPPQFMTTTRDQVFYTPPLSIYVKYTSLSRNSQYNYFLYLKLKFEYNTIVIYFKLYYY